MKKIKQTPQFPEDERRVRGSKFWDTIESIAEDFGTEPLKVIKEINRFGRLVNYTLGLEKGRVSLLCRVGFGGTKEAGNLKEIRHIEELFEMGVMAYSAYTSSRFLLQFYDGEKTMEWYPRGHLHTKEEVLEGILGS